jgi:hypothetical protein
VWLRASFSRCPLYEAVPDFHVPKKKEKCICAHCKARRQALDDIVVVVNTLRCGLLPEDDLRLRLNDVRTKILTLHGHLERNRHRHCRWLPQRAPWLASSSLHS